VLVKKGSKLCMVGEKQWISLKKEKKIEKREKGDIVRLNKDNPYPQKMTRDHRRKIERGF